MYLLAKIRFNRSNALTDAYDYMTNDAEAVTREPEAVKHYYTADGSWVSDNDDPKMGATNTRFGSNIPPRKVRPDVENMTPSSREVGKLRWRKLDPETGKEIVKPAIIMNDLGGGWIQFQFHNFGGNTKRDPVSQCPHLIARDPKENWPDNQAVIDRTTKDPTRVTDNGRPTVISEREMAWIQGQLYGTNQEEQTALRSFAGGQMLVDSDLHLPEDLNKPGIDKTGFNNNYNPLLSLLHWLFVSEHNALADHYAYFHPDWDDEKLFQMARKANCAQIARIHTVEWTEDLLQHPTLQIGMHADWYGFLGQRRKMALMRFFHRHPRIARCLSFLRNNEMIWGMPGSKWEHHDGSFQVPKHFRLVYRLHEMILGEHEIVDPSTGRTLDRIELLDFVHGNTREIVAKYGYDVLAWSFVKKSAGALTLHNFPRALTRFHNQQDDTLTDLAERDTFRERTDGTGSYNEFRLSLGEPPVTSFMELTGGDKEMADELEAKFEGDIDAVVAGIGILVEPKPDGFALGFCQFYQFVLNAPRRVKSNRHLTEGFTYDEYVEGLDWVEHGGGILGVMQRHLAGIRPMVEGVVRGFAPWLETETFPLRMLTQTHQDTGTLFKSDLRTIALAAVACSAAVWSGVFGLGVAALVLGLLSFGTVSNAIKRMLAMRYMQQVWQKCYTDKRGFMFGKLYQGEAWINRAALYGRLGAGAIMAVGAGLALSLHATHPLVALLMALVALKGIKTWKRSNAFVADAQLLKVSLRNRMRDGLPQVDPATLPARPMDMDAFELMFRRYAPGRDYLTAYDFDRMHEGDRVRKAQQGVGNWFTRLFAQMAAKRRTNKLLMQFADRVHEQDHKLVTAISKQMYLRHYQGAALVDLLREREDALDPSPVPMNSLPKLSVLGKRQLARLYASCPKGEIPQGESNGRAVYIPGRIAGRFFSALNNLAWKGKIFTHHARGVAVHNKIFGMHAVKADVFNGASWCDGGEATIIDYRRTSWLAFFLRNEIRQVLPDLYLGKAYVRLPFGHRFALLYFTLDFQK